MSLENYKNKYVIIRAEGPGVHFGNLESYDEITKVAYLKDARHLWKWIGFTLYSCANRGMANDEAMLSEIIPEIMINNVLTIMTCTEKAVENIKNYPTHDPLGLEKK